MRVLLDGELVDECKPNTVCEALSAVADITDKHGRMIVEVKVDGAIWTGQRIESELGTANGADEVSLTSCDTRELVTSAFQDASEALTVADAKQREAAELIQSDRREEAMEPLAEAVTIWQSVEKAVLLGLEIENGTPERAKQEELIKTSIEQLNRHLVTIRDALQSDDPIGLSDTLLYDLPEVVQQWRSMLLEMTPIAQNQG